MTIATSTLEASYGLAAARFGDEILAAANDATAIQSTVRGLADGRDYGRYVVGQNPLLTYAPFAGSLDALIAQGVALRALVARAVTAMIAAASGDPGGFADSVSACVEALRGACADPRDAIRLFAGLSGFSVAVNAGSDAIGKQIAGLAEDAAVLMRRSAGIALAEASADFVPNSQQDAQSVRDRVADILDAVALAAADRFEDRSYAGLDALRVAVVNDLTQRGGSLAPVATRTLPAPLPAPVAAQLLYRDGARAAELVARNDPLIPHPGFLPVTIEASAV